MPRDHTAQARDRLARNLARIEAARRHAIQQGEQHRRLLARRIDELSEHQERLAQGADDPSTWTPEALAELQRIATERRKLEALYHGDG